MTLEEKIKKTREEIIKIVDTPNLSEYQENTFIEKKLRELLESD